MIQMSQTERAKFRVFKGPHALDVKFLFHYKEGQSADMGGIRILQDRGAQHIC